jgi:hypothetical protein
MDQMLSERKMPTRDVRLLKSPKINKIAIALSVVAKIRAKRSGLTLTRFPQKEIQL